MGNDLSDRRNCWQQMKLASAKLKKDSKPKVLPAVGVMPVEILGNGILDSVNL